MDDLIKAVEAGDDDAVKQIIWGVASAARDKGQFFPAHDVLKAYRGSLDAAKAVKDALLPEWEWNIDARAWLLATLKALQAEGRG